MFIRKEMGVATYEDFAAIFGNPARMPSHFNGDGKAVVLNHNNMLGKSAAFHFLQ